MEFSKEEIEMLKELISEAQLDGFYEPAMTSAFDKLTAAGEVMYQVYLVSFLHSRGTGRTTHYRTDGQTPGVSDIVSMERELSAEYEVNEVCVTGIYRLADSENNYGEASWS